MATKPISKPLKYWLIDLTAEELKMDESICEAVISWTYRKTTEAFKDNDSIEVSGFGKFLLSQNKLKKRIKGYEKSIAGHRARIAKYPDEKTVEGGLKQLKVLEERLAYLKSRLKENEVEGNS